MLFSQRGGHKPVRSALQLEGIDDPLRVALWNVLLRTVASDLEGPGTFRDVRSKYLWSLVWSDFLHVPLDEMAAVPQVVLRQLKEWFMAAQWYELYHLLEAVIAAMEKAGLDSSRFKKLCNETLEKEMSGYRLVGRQVAPIVSDEEISEIERTLQQSVRTPVETHLSCALALLSDRRQPDYRNSIKESVSAVEAAARAFVGQPQATLGDATKQLEKQFGLHPALASAFSKLYGYTSDADGIRHALMDKPKVDFADAKFMLVVCAAFSSYLTAKTA